MHITKRLKILTLRCRESLLVYWKEVFLESVVYAWWDWLPDFVLSTQAFLIIGKICCTIGPESTVRLYFWRPPRTRSRRTPTKQKNQHYMCTFPFRVVISNSSFMSLINSVHMQYHLFILSYVYLYVMSVNLTLQNVLNCIFHSVCLLNKLCFH